MKKAKIAVLPIVAVLSSCASHLTQEQCETISWKAEGYRDAEQGKMPRDLRGAIEDCAKFNLKVNKGQYMQGWKQGAKKFCTPTREVGFVDGQAGKSSNAINYRLPVCNRAGINLNRSQYNAGRYQGLKQYCTYENGSNIARQGLPLPNVCPKELNAKFRKGWMSSKKKYCQDASTGFALGKAGKVYPSICPTNLYPAFKSEYDRGMTIGSQIRAGEKRIRVLNDRINSLYYRYQMDKTVDGYYKLARNMSPEAQQGLQEVNRLVSERKAIERDIFNLKVQR